MLLSHFQKFLIFLQHTRYNFRDPVFLRLFYLFSLIYLCNSYVYYLPRKVNIKPLESHDFIEQKVSFRFHSNQKF
jgi:hypothetical protein